MDKRKLNRITVGFVALMALVIILMLVNGLRRTAHITLPQESDVTDNAQEDGELSGSDLTLVEIRPDTVQSAIAALERPTQYRRTFRVMQFWSGGSGENEVSVAVNGPWTRTDRTQADGRVRHSLTDGEVTYIWYDSEKDFATLAAGSITADQEQMIPTYEDVLALEAEQIALADYRMASDMKCIYVETAENEDGYVSRFWVNVDTGLLVAAERQQDGETIYRMGELSMVSDPAFTNDFTLPDGTVVMG